MQSILCNRCPIWAKCGLTYGSKNCRGVLKENGIVMTNFEKIKDMTVEEMAQFLQEIRYDNYGTLIIRGALIFTDADFVAWLESEVQENG